MGRGFEKHSGSRRSGGGQYGLIELLTFVAIGLGIFTLGLICVFAIWSPKPQNVSQYQLAASFGERPSYWTPMLRGSLSE